MLSKLMTWVKTQNRKRLQDRQKEVREEAARRINLREVKDEKTGTRGLAICLDDTIVYWTAREEVAEETVLNEILNLREYYCRLWGPTPDIELL